MPVDEFQFISGGANANSLAAKVLLQLLGIGPRLLFCANYSLIHKLMKRDQQDRQRLLSKPIVLLPLGSKDSDWIRFLEVVQSTAPGLLTFDPDSDATDIHTLTFGIKRLAIELIVAAVPFAMGKNRSGSIGIQELRSAYKSEAYTTHRKDVEILHEQAIRGQMIREDLWCPFVDVEPKQNIARLDVAIQHFEEKTEDALLEAAMTPKERESTRAIMGDKPVLKAEARVYRLRGKRATKEDLLNGLDSFSKMV